ITAKGRQELRLSQVISGDERVESPLKIVPKGLRSFDAEDQDFFLELLPGPRRGDGLPESVHFWKVRIEEMDPDKTFRVGYIFGPSGCGKSSLVKAGLLPRLSKPIIPIYIEATGEDTEARLLRGLRKQYPDLPADLDLRAALVAAREKIRVGSNKILLVIDQFEQWYHAKGAEPGTELAKALSECDGGRVQAIILVRDDFSMALHRFMAVIGVRQNQDQNFAVVDLFDLQHARKVLIAFGRGYGMLPDDPKEMTCGQNDFLKRTLQGLSQEGRVVSVRLALFAEMLKGKPWTPETLKQVRGTEGVGVTYLEETFSARTAPPSYRIHQKAAQAVLRALLPEAGSNIKGNMRSYDELLVVSGYGSRPNEFDELLRILNSELRLISPIEREGSESDGQTKAPVGEKFYLLTHDYLVLSIRDWLTRKQRETRRGRAELRLAERSASWNAKPENRQLPYALEWANIRMLTKKKDWTEPQRKMMRRAGRVHGLRSLGLAVLIALVSWGGMEGYGRLRASALVESLQSCVTSDVPAIVKKLSRYRRWADPKLVRAAQGTDAQTREHLHASLALLPVDSYQFDYLFNRLLSATENELPVLREALKTYQSTLTPKLWAVLESAKPDAGLLPAASALASYDPNNARWESAGGKVAQALVSVNSIYLGNWLEYLTDVRSKLTAPLATIFRDRNRSESDRTQAINILALYASDDLDLITNLLMDANLTAYDDFFLIAQRQETNTLQLLQAEIAKKATISDSDKDSEMVKDRLAGRQARAAIALVRMGKVEEVWSLLRHSADPRLRSFIVNWLNPLGADPKLIVAELDRIDPNTKPTPTQGQRLMDAILFHPETSQRRAMILALGQYGEERLSAEDRKPLIDKLLALYENDPDAGIHGAAEWTLWKWGQEESLKEKDAAMRGKEPGEHRWY
ncbi:MAG: ATP-binding protein, partial [Isosphaeraceae bacterium]